ncbi:MAG: CAF17-like 4Fe-4S cluster assembly/insertion protein YgfZ [Ignavibacteriaceae bacterium]
MMFDVEIKYNSLLDYLESAGYTSEMINGKKKIKVFSSVEDELNSLCMGVGLRDISQSGIIELRGKDVLDFFHRITTNSLKDLQKENLTHTIFTSEKGRIIDVATIFNFDDHQLLICSEANKEKVLSWINKYVITDDVHVNDSIGNYVFLELLGQQSASFMTLVCGNSVNEIKLNQFKLVRTEGLIFIVAKLKEINGTEKFWILADATNGIQLTKYMIEHVGPFDFNLIGEDAYNIYRVTKGIPAAPNELNDQFNPHEAGLISMVNFTKGCYIGQEVIARLETYDKVQKYLKRIIFHQPVDENGKFLLFDEEGNDAGVVTSIVYSPKSNKYFGLGYVRKAYCADGKILEVKNQSGESVKVTIGNIPVAK